MSLIDDAHKGMTAAYLPAAPAAPALRCRCCGSVPAEDVTFRSNRGFVLARQTTTYRGPFCRDCGISTSRKANGINLIAGWWGYISVFVTPVYLVMNAVARRKVGKLAAPQYPAPGYSPLPVGRPLMMRWQAIGFLLPIVLVVVIIAAIASNGSNTSDGNDGNSDNGLSIPQVGTCIVTTGNTTFDYVDCSAPHNGKITSIVTDASDCPTDSLFVARAIDKAGAFYCIENG